MTKKTKKIIALVVGLWVAICVIMAIAEVANREMPSPVQKKSVELLEKVSPSSTDIKGTVIGRWRLTSEMAPDLNSTIVIYERADSCFCMETYDKGSTNIKLLRKEGNKYYDTESTFGEYFLITNGSLRLYDKEGEYGGGSGYTITTLE